MLGQSCNGEFALGEIEDNLGVGAVAGVALFTADREAILYPGLSTAGEVIFGFQAAAIVTVSFAPSAVITVEID